MDCTTNSKNWISLKVMMIKTCYSYVIAISAFFENNSFFLFFFLKNEALKKEVYFCKNMICVSRTWRKQIDMNIDPYCQIFSANWIPLILNEYIVYVNIMFIKHSNYYWNALEFQYAAKMSSHVSYTCISYTSIFDFYCGYTNYTENVCIRVVNWLSMMSRIQRSR